MNQQATADVTTLLGRIRSGDAAARNDLFRLVYDELKRIAAAKIAERERPSGQTLQTTALVHEVYLRLQGSDLSDVQNRRHFFGIVGRAMEQVLIDRHRAKATAKRGGDYQRVPLDDVLDSLTAQQQLDIEDLHDALARLERRNESQAEIIRRRFFCGHTHAEIACDLSWTVSQVEDAWYAARAWLRRQLTQVSDARK